MDEVHAPAFIGPGGWRQGHAVLGDELLEPAIFLLDEAEAFGLGDFEAAELVAPLVERGLTDAVAATEAPA
jgi:hypothetical protein